MDLYCDIRGNGLPILCLHGHPGSARTMAVFCERLSRQYQTLAPDLRGYGASQVRQPFQLEESLVDLVALLDRQGIDQCWVLGWSLGGILALELALRPWLEVANTGLASLLNLAIPGHPWVIRHFGQNSLYRYLLQQHTPAAYQRLAKEGFGAFVRTSRHAHQALNQAMARGYNRLPEVGQINVPCLVLCGEQDCHITAQSSLETARHLPQADSHCYANTAHLLPWEIPERILNDIEAWLECHTSTTAVTPDR